MLKDYNLEITFLNDAIPNIGFYEEFTQLYLNLLEEIIEFEKKYSDLSIDMPMDTYHDIMDAEDKYFEEIIDKYRTSFDNIYKTYNLNDFIRSKNMYKYSSELIRDILFKISINVYDISTYKNIIKLLKM